MSQEPPRPKGDLAPSPTSEPSDQDAAAILTRSLGQIIDLRDKRTGEHCRMVGEIAGRTAVLMGLPAAECRLVNFAGQLHDLGKIAIPDRLLHNTDELKPAELDLMRAHVNHGTTMIMGLADLSDDFATIALIVSGHHERWNGAGYPKGLAGADIPLGARILAVVDAYSALIMARSYQAALDHFDALPLIRAGAGTHFDPAVVAAFESLCHSGDIRLGAR